MADRVKVFCYPAGPSSLYIPLLFTGLRSRYEPLLGADAAPAEAVASLRRGEAAILHIHWEEFVLLRCATREEARGAALLFEERMRAFRRLGGRTAWTVHNILPHRVPHVEEFLGIRRFLSGFADCILLHNASALPVLRGQVPVPEDRVAVLPHPAYTGLYEPVAAAEAGTGVPADRTLLCFGSVRRQKALDRFVGMLPPDFLAAHGARIRISGTGAEAGLVRAGLAARDDLLWDLRYVPMEEAPGLIRGAACVVLPYERFLTSGVALLVMSVGGLLVAADAPQLREIFPPEAHRFLHPPGDAVALRRVVAEVLSLGQQERVRLRRANLEAARRYDPAIIGESLASIYAALAPGGSAIPGRSS